MKKLNRSQLRKLVINEVTRLSEMRMPVSKCVNGIIYEEIIQDQYMSVDSLLKVMADKDSANSLDYYKGAYAFAASGAPPQYGGMPPAVSDMMDMAEKLGMNNEEINNALYSEYYALLVKYPDGFVPTQKRC